MMKVVTLPNPILRLKSKEVKKIEPEIKNLVSQMRETLESQKDPEGIGLAAVQVGELYRIFLAKIRGKSTIFINPQITSSSKENSELVEGCLSVPEYYGVVKRSAKVTVNAQNLRGRWFEKELSSLPAKIIQHEIDHLEGILFIDHLANQKQKLFRRIGKDKKGQDQFTEVKVPWIK